MVILAGVFGKFCASAISDQQLDRFESYFMDKQSKKRTKKIIPHFSSEDQERRFWGG